MPKSDEAGYDGSTPLPNAKHEMFARGLFDGMSQEAAYQRAGYKGDRTKASRLLATNGNIRIRVDWLKKSRDGTLAETVKFDAISLFTRLSESIAAAQKDGDHKSAMDGHKMMLGAFGYLDHPTLTHDHIHQRRVRLDAAPADTSDDGEVVDLERTTGPDGDIFAQALDKFRSTGAAN